MDWRIAKVHKETIEKIEYKPKISSNEFAGIYVYGWDRDFKLEENEAPILAFRHYSQYSYPIFLFCNKDKTGEVEKLADKYENINIILIEEMRSIKDYDHFMITECFQRIPKMFNRLLNFHEDGFLLKAGWEDFVLEHDFDYIGAPWNHIETQDNEYALDKYLKFKIKDGTKWEDIKSNTVVGNGGFCYRKRDKALQVVDRIDLKDYEQKWKGGQVCPDDMFYSFHGFGLGYFKPVSVELAKQFSEEPYCGADTFGFHRLA